MSQEHDKMVRALKEIVVTKLREKGFKGSFPHFRRLRDEKIDLLTFQFDKWGGGFVIEISKCSPTGITTHWGAYIPPNKVRAWDLHPNKRLRLQPRSGSSTSEWFRYDGAMLNDNIFDKTAREVLPFLEKAEKWWAEVGTEPSILEE
jgi:Domain of unknown function (DUF4304)